MKITDVYPVKEPKPWASKKAPVACANPNLIVGLEIEVEGLDHDSDWYDNNLPDIWQVKTDGSLRGRNNGNRVPGNAYEFISRPAAIKSLIPELKDFYEITRITEDNFNDRCSIHVHTNITNMEVEQVGTLFLIYSVVEDLLFRFVNHYGVDDPRGKYRDTNIYCVPWNQCRMNSDMVTKMFNDPDYVFKAWQKYTALNILPTRSIGTVEWRHLHGTANVQKLTLWLNLIGQIMKYAQEKKFEEAVKTIKELNDNSMYQQFLGEVLGPYIPFTPETAKALELGVVNAKYTLINLKDFTVKTKPKAKKASLRDRLEGDLMDWAEPLRVRPLEARPEQEAAQAAPPPPEAFLRGVLRVQNEDTAERIRAVNAIAIYPLKRVHIVTEEHGVEWGIQDALGRTWNINGFLRHRVVAVDILGLNPTYCQGLGEGFWANVPADWRPNQQERVEE